MRTLSNFDRNLLENDGWVIDSETPLRIHDKIGSVATNIACLYILMHLKSKKEKKYPVVFDTDYEMMMKDNSIEKDKIIEHILESKKEKIEFQKKWKGKKLSLKEVEERIDEFAMITFDGKEILV